MAHNRAYTGRPSTDSGPSRVGQQGGRMNPQADKLTVAYGAHSLSARRSAAGQRRGEVD